MTSETNWRRRWKPTLATVSWRSILSDQYFVKYIFTANSYEIMVADKVNTYHEALDEDNCKKRSKKFNPSVEAPLGRLLDHIKESLNDESKSNSVKIKASEEKLILSLETKLAGLPFIWKFNAKPCSTEMVSEHLTVPLMGMVGELLRRQSELIKVIHNKDKEIDDYKNQGVKVTRKHLQTSVFDDTVFKNNMNTSQGFESQVSHMGKYSFIRDAQELYENMMCKNAFLNRDTTEDEDMEEPAPGSPAKPAVGHSWANRVPGSLIPPATESSAGSAATRSPTKSPQKVAANTSPVKDTELIRRQALEKRLLEEEEKMEEKQKKKKKKLKI